LKRERGSQNAVRRNCHSLHARGRGEGLLRGPLYLRRNGVKD